MADLKFNKGVDQEHEVKLDSFLISASWMSGVAYTGSATRFVVQTAFVGNGAAIEITGKSESGKKLGKIKGEINGNSFADMLDIPDDLKEGDKVYFEVKLSKNGLNGESERIPVYRGPRIKEMKWSATEARRGDTLKLTAKLEDVRDNTECQIIIYEHDQDGAHDKIAEIPAVFKGGQAEVQWEDEYHEDTDEIPTEEERQRYGGAYNPPEYFFTVKFEDLELGRRQESGLLTFKDYIEITLKDMAGNPRPNENYKLHLPDGSERAGQLDANGYARERDIPPGNVLVEFPNLRQVNPENQEDT